MSEIAEGFSLKFTVECFGPDGQQWSDTENAWFGMKDEYTMNRCALGIINAVSAEVASWNDAKYGAVSVSDVHPGKVK